ncbi:hypothetical protein HPF70_0913, partial [Helicobacter pylori]
MITNNNFSWLSPFGVTTHYYPKP